MLKGKWEIVVEENRVKSITLDGKPLDNVLAAQINIESGSVIMWLKVRPQELVYSGDIGYFEIHRNVS